MKKKNISPSQEDAETIHPDSRDTEISRLRYELAIARENARLHSNNDWTKISARVNIKEGERLFRKVGNRYIPVNDPYAYNGLSHGFWLVKVENGCTSIRAQVHPEQSALTAAARILEEKLISYIRSACEVRPSKTTLTAEEKKDWEAFIAKHGESFNTLHYPSFAENAEKIVQILVDRAARDAKLMPQ